MIDADRPKKVRRPVSPENRRRICCSVEAEITPVLGHEKRGNHDWLP